MKLNEISYRPLPPESFRYGLFRINANITLWISIFLPVILGIAIMHQKSLDQFTIFAAIVFASICLYIINIILIKHFLPQLEKAGMAGKDLNKEGKMQNKPPV